MLISLRRCSPAVASGPPNLSGYRLRVRLSLPGLRDHVVDRARAHHQHDIPRPAQRAQERGGLRERAAIVDGPGTTSERRTLLDGAHQIVAVYEAGIHLARGLRLDDHHLVGSVE